ncbi:MAG: TspO/MBR family protein [Hyphomicrobiales bacterium]
MAAKAIDKAIDKATETGTTSPIGARLKPADFWALFLFLLLCLGVGAAAGAATSGPVQDWYPTLVKPFFNPPPWIFAPVWTVLYIMMAVAAWRVWRTGLLARPALWIFGLQLALNFLWSFLFFSLHSPGLALIEIILLWLAIAATLRAFYTHDGWAAALLAPYLAWVSFAAVLNASVWMLN